MQHILIINKMKKQQQTHQQSEHKGAGYYISFVILFLILFLPNITGCFIANDITGTATTTIYLVSAFLFLLFGLTVMPQRLFFYVATPVLLLNAVELIYQIMNHATTSVMFIYTMVAAEKGEFFELVTTYWPILLIFIPIVALYICLAKFHIPDEFLFSNPRIRRAVASVTILWFLVGSFTLIHFKYIREVNDDDYESPTAFVGMSKVCPINLFVQSVHLANIWENINGRKRALQDFSFGIEPNQSDDNMLVVFLIGETARYDHWGLNGYHRNTSPCLGNRDDLVSFDSCYSISNLTAISVPYMISRATPNDTYPYSHEKALPEAFSEAGFRTAWIADQSFTNVYMRRVSSSCDVAEYVPNGRFKGEFHDSILIAPFCNYIHRNNGHKQFAIVHSLGSHFKYSYRYPDKFSVFQPDLKDVKAMNLLTNGMNSNNRFIADNEQIVNNVRDVLINSYDNTILYIDMFIDSLINIIDATNRPAIFLYVGDHGENLMDDERLMLLHGSYSGSAWEYHVPMFIWTSPEYQKLHPDKWQTIKENKSRKISTMNIFHSMIDMADIEYDNLDKTKCIDSPSLVADTISWGLDANLQLTILPTN